MELQKSGNMREKVASIEIPVPNLERREREERNNSIWRGREDQTHRMPRSGPPEVSLIS